MTKEQPKYEWKTVGVSITVTDRGDWSPEMIELYRREVARFNFGALMVPVQDEEDSPPPSVSSTGIP